uniref:Uncharacterized protein n=1 Tax=Timema tahoe TaxID=61484 RepID=A0A7R9NZ67_9NEOP|nr:unnamed protein product [Timema tahoe]
MRSVVLRIETCLQEWFTVHTVKLLLGEDICQGLQQLNITEETGPVLPLVDLHAQNALRRRIVLDRLNRVLPEMLAALGLSDCDIATGVRELVGSFSLSAHNITFHPAEWNFLGLIIIHSLVTRSGVLGIESLTGRSRLESRLGELKLIFHKFTLVFPIFTPHKCGFTSS